MSRRCPMRDGKPLKNQTCEHGRSQIDVTETFAANFRLRNFDTAFIADHAAMLHSFIFSAETFPIRNRTENSRAEQPVALRFKCAVIDSFRLRNFAVRPRTNFFRRREADANRLKIRGQLCFIILLQSETYNISKFQSFGFQSYRF